MLPWDHISAGLHKDFLWQDWRDALDEVGLEDCRWTPCYDCGACTGYGIEHVVASAVPARRRQPGHRPGPRVRRRGARRHHGPAHGRRIGAVPDAGPAALRQGRQGPLHQPPRPGPHLGAGAAPGRHPARLLAGLLAAAPAALRPGPARPAPSPGPSTSTPTCVESAPVLDDLPERLTPMLPAGIDVTAAAPVEAGTQSLQQAVVCCDWRIEVLTGGGRRRGGRRAGAGGGRAPAGPGAQGAGHRRRHPALRGGPGGRGTDRGGHRARRPTRDAAARAAPRRAGRRPRRRRGLGGPGVRAGPDHQNAPVDAARRRPAGAPAHGDVRSAREARAS